MKPVDSNDPPTTLDPAPNSASGEPPESPTPSSPVVPLAGTVSFTSVEEAAPGQTDSLSDEPAVATDREPPVPGVPGYEIEGVLGRGGMGVVYKARHLALKRNVALKMILNRGHAGPRELARFRIEAEAVARLQHPNIVQIHEVGEADGHPYCALEFVEGGNLARKIKGQPLPSRESARLVVALARAMQLAHSRNVVHRDLKPANILLTPDGMPKISDFGLARQLDSDRGQTQAGTLMGTPSYMAPEQASGRGHEAGPAADVYALGAILYACLVGRPPFKGQTVVETLDQVRTQEPVPPSHCQKNVPLDLETICLKCLRKEPETRYASAAELADDLERFLAGEPILARPALVGERLLKWARRRPTQAAAFALLVLSLLLGSGAAVALSLWQTAENGRRTTEAALIKEAAARTNAEEAKKQAEQAKEGESAARDAVEQSNKNLTVALKDAADARDGQKRLRYFGLMQSALQEWGVGEVARARRRLAAAPKEWRQWEYGYVARLCNPELLTLDGHSRPIRAVVFSPDGRRFASGGDDSFILVRDSATLKLIRKIDLPSGCTPGLAFNPDGTLLAGSGTDGSVRIWDAATGELARPQFQKHTQRSDVNAVAFAPDGRRVASAGFGETDVLVWDSVDATILFSLVGHDRYISAVAFSPDGKSIASASADETVKLWDSATGKLVRTLKHRAGVRAVSYSADSKRLATACDNNAISVWNTETGTLVRSLTGHTDEATCVSLSADGKRVASGSIDRSVRLWDVETGKELLTHTGHTHKVWTVAFSPDGKRIVSGGHDGAVKVWGLAPVRDAQTLAGHTTRVRRVAFGADSKRLVSGGGTFDKEDGSIKVWDLTTGLTLLSLGGKFPCIWAVAFSPDGRQIVGGGDQGFLKVWDAQGRNLFELSGHKGSVYDAVFSPDGKLIASAGDSGPRDKEGRAGDAITLWDATTGRPVRTFEGQEKAVHGICFSPDGRRLASAGDQGDVRVWDVATGELRHTLRGHSSYARCVQFSADGRRLASTSIHGDVRLWDAETGTEERIIRGHEDAVWAVAFHPDGKRLVSGGNDFRVQLWDAATGDEVLSLKVHEGAITGLVFSPDGQRLASASADGTIRVWDGTPPTLETRRAGGRQPAGSHRQELISARARQTIHHVVSRAASAMTRPLALSLSTILIVPLVIVKLPRLWKVTPPTVVPTGLCRWLTVTVPSKVLPSYTW